MVPELRSRFNASYRPELYQRFLQRLDEGSGAHVKFRNSETPCFLPAALLDRMAREGAELIAQLMQPDYLRESDQTIPPQFDVPNQDAHPLFLQVDFGIAANLEPKLVEIQAFPSLYAYQPFLADTYREVYDLDPGLNAFLGGLDRPSYEALVRRALLGDHAPENVVLLEIEPQEQKTLPDFLLTQKLFGVRPACITKVEKRGRKLFYEGIPIDRIYNRAIVDELVRKDVQPAFDFRDDLDVEWAGHPNWYFRISKFSIPFLKHPCVPRSQFLSDVKEMPEDLENWVLKPLYSFAGLGVVVGPTKADIDAVEDPAQYILQERVTFEPVIETPHGGTKAEVRIMYVWVDGAPVATTTIIRMGRGKMMGVDHNRNMEWVGASAGFRI